MDDKATITDFDQLQRALDANDSATLSDYLSRTETRDLLHAITNLSEDDQSRLLLALSDESAAKLVDPLPGQARQAVGIASAQADVDRADVEGLITAVSEVVTNATVHGRHPIEVNAWVEADQVVGMARRWAEAAPPLLARRTRAATTMPGLSLETAAVPYALVGVVSPWNFPLLLGLIDAIPALAAGCAVIVKPSEVTPRFAEPLAAAIDSVPLLRDVLAVVEGAGDVGAAVVDRVDAVCFTGSVPTGRAVARAAVERFIPAFLELGGKDPAIVLPGADLERASSALLWGGTANAGQSCLSIERVYVHESQHDELVGLLCAKAERLELALPTPGSGAIGPLIDAEQATVIQAHLDDAIGRGALVRTGGTIERHDGGHWIRPTVLTGVDHSMAVMTEETGA